MFNRLVSVKVYGPDLSHSIIQSLPKACVSACLVSNESS